MVEEHFIDSGEIIEFCEEYNSLGFGKAEVTESKSAIILKLYNAGYSENEDLNEEFRNKYKNYIIHDKHPILFAKFEKTK